SKLYEVELIFVFALNKRIESVLNFEKEKLHTGFLSNEQVERILGASIKNFIAGDYGIKFFINHNLKIHSLKNVFLARNLAVSLNDYDLIHFNGLDATLLLVNSFLRYKKKVFTIHDVKLHSGEKNRKVLNVAENLCKWLIKSKHQIILQNNSDYNEILKKYPNKKEKINIIPFKCLSIFKGFLNDNTSLVESDILFFGRISPYKGLKYLVDAIEIVKKTIPDVRVVIAGGGNIEKDLPKEKVNGSYTIHNRYISNEEMAGYVANTKIVVCPYIDATQSGVVMTSFAFGKPVIASTVGGFLDVIEDKVTGLLVPPRDVKGLANAIISLLSDSKRIDEMSKNIINICDKGNLSWDYIVKDVKKVYDKALKKRK
ncbi:MAG: glycosyltransferase family 4 protein, partial [Ignavibacteriae bacterium]|nr:glycosyltransferase family 4 protein [Ignavibacteriota bacterium]